MHRGQAGSQLWAKVEAARVKCARNAPSSCQPASSLSVGWEGWLGMQCYIHLRRPRSADLTLPEELGPYLCKWLPWSGVGLIPPRARSFIPRDTPPLTSGRPSLFFPPKGSSCYQNRAYIQYYWTSRVFPDIETKHMG